MCKTVIFQDVKDDKLCVVTPYNTIRELINICPKLAEDGVQFLRSLDVKPCPQIFDKAQI